MNKHFEEALARIKAEVGIKTLSGLAEIVGSSQQYVSKKSKESEFPVRWAYLVGKKYGLLTEWIMTGEGPKRIEEKGRSAFLVELEGWAKEVSESENLKWLENQIENQFPDFKRWREEKTQPSEITADCPSSKVA